MKFERGYAQHIGSRQEQQDAGFVASDEARGEQLVVIADGMGGHAGGSIASAQVAETAKRLWAEHQKTPIEPKRLLERIVREGHESINKAGAEKGLTPRSTCALLFVRNGNAHWAHVGDSRVYRLRDGQITRLTRDHSVVQMLVDLGKVSEEEMGTHPDQNRLTQSLGGDAVPMPDFGSDSVKPHDAFLICSDGLWEMIPQPEMASALAAKKLGDEGAKHLADRAFDRAKPKSDNITVALVRIDGPPAAIAVEDAVTTRLPPVATAARPASGGSARWAFAAATLVGLAAAVAIIKPWEARTPDSTTGTPGTGTTPRTDETKPPPKPDAEPQPADRRAPAPPPPTTPTPPIQTPPAQTPPAQTPPAQSPPATPPAQPPVAPPTEPPASSPPGVQPPGAQPPGAQPPGAQPPAMPPPGGSQPPPQQPQPGATPGNTPEPPKQPTPPGDPAKKEGERLENPGSSPPIGAPAQPAQPPTRQ